MKLSKRLRLLLSQMPIGGAFGDSGHEIQASQSSLKGKPIEIENIDNALDNRDFELRPRLVTSTDATNNHESTEQITAGLVTKKEDVQGDAIGDIIEEVAIEIFYGDLVQKGTTNEEVAKETDFEDVVSDEVTESNIISESFSERDSVQVDLLSLDDNMEDDAEKNNIEKCVIAGSAVGTPMENSNGDAVGKEVVKNESEDGDDGRVLA